MFNEAPENTALIIDSQYFGTIDYIKTLFRFSNIEIEQYENYRKMSFRNRCLVAGSNGLVNLSVPLVNGRDARQLMKDTRINYAGRWQLEQVRTLASCYARAPYFEYFWPDVRELVLARPEFLLDKNMAILEWLRKIFRLDIVVALTSIYRVEYDHGYTDLRNRTRPNNYLALDPGIRYTQVFQDRIGFQPNLSVLDYLFCAGTDLKSSLKGSDFLI